MRAGRVAGLVLLVGLSAGPVAACGAGGPPAHRAWRTPAPVAPTADVTSTVELAPGEILDQAVRATQAAGSVHLRGQLGADGYRFTLDMRYDATGGLGRIRVQAVPRQEREQPPENFEGRSAGRLGGVSWPGRKAPAAGPGAENQTVDVVRIQREVWFSGDTGFWRRVGGERAVKDFRTRYLKISASDSRYAPLVDTTYSDKVVHLLLRARGTFAKSGTTVLRGQKAVVLIDRSSDTGGTVWVAAEGPPYLLRIEAAKDSAANGSVDFLDYNTRFTLPVPDPRRVIDAGDLDEPSNSDDQLTR